jgi:hypothetical protein
MGKGKIIAATVASTVTLTVIGGKRAVNKVRITKAFNKEIEKVKRWETESKEKIKWNEEIVEFKKDLNLWNKLSEWQQENLTKELKSATNRVEEKRTEKRLQRKREQVDEVLQKKFYNIQREFEEKYRKREKDLNFIVLDLGTIDTIQKEKIDKSLKEMRLKMESL